MHSASVSISDDFLLSSQAEWEANLARYQVSGGSLSQQQTFYTSVYHHLLAPTTYSEAGGIYRYVRDRGVGRSCSADEKKANQQRDRAR